MKIAILYICTGKYDVFWKGFYTSSEKYFLPSHHKEYFVFTDNDISPVNERVHPIHQEKLGWPYDTLMRFKMFHSIDDRLKYFDLIFFLNANMRFLTPVTDEILPSKKEGLLMVKHPGFFNKERKEFTYETNPLSLAYISENEGEHYFMGGFNGGWANDYLTLIETLNSNINKDLQNGIIALWHDESHLNSYMIGKRAKILNPDHGYPEGWEIPFEKKVIILDKSKLGGHSFLREETKGSFFKRVLYKIRNFWT